MLRGSAGRTGPRRRSLASLGFAVSGIANVDAFFSAVLDFTGVVETVAQNIQIELKGLYGLVGATGPGDFEAALRAKLQAYVDVEAGFSVRAEPARCEASLAVTAKAAAQCDVDATPGSVESAVRAAARSPRRRRRPATPRAG